MTNLSKHLTRTPQKPRRLISCSALALTLISGCTTIQSAAKLSRLSPLETDPAQLRLAVRTPETIKIRDGDIKLIMSFENDDPAIKLSQSYIADIDDMAKGAPGIKSADIGKGNLTIVAITTEDAARMRALQKRIKALRASGIKGSGSIGVAATGCSTSPTMPSSIPIRVWMQTEPDDQFFVLAPKIDLAEAIAASDKPMERCKD